MNTRNILAAAALTMLAGVAFAEGEDHIDYTGKTLAGNRAEVIAQTKSFNVMHGDFLARANEAYGTFDAPASIWSSTENNGMAAEANSAPYIFVRVNEAWGGFPLVGEISERGE